MILKVKVLNENARVPAYATAGSAAFDLVSTHGVNITPNEAKVVGTGLAFEVPEGHVMLVFSRSGHGFNNGLRLANCVGVIDSDYRGEVKAKIHNDSNTTYQVKAGERIAQAMIVPIAIAKFMVVEELGTTERGEGGIGSTGLSAKDQRILDNLGGDFEHIKPQGEKVYARV